MNSSTGRKNTSPRLEVSVIQGWRAEFRLWWAMTKHVDVVFDKSPPSLQHINVPNATPGSISMCRGCCQILSTRMCSGKTIDNASGCAFHRKRPDVPIAVRSIITSTRLREMLKPRMIVERYYLRVAPVEAKPAREAEGVEEAAAVGAQGGEQDDQEQVDQVEVNLPVEARIQTNLMNVGWVRRIRLGNRETRRSKKVYVHDDEGGCIHSSNPDVIVQGLGPKHLYFKRCDGLFVNALGERLETTPVHPEDDEPLDKEQGDAAAERPENELASAASHDDYIQVEQQNDDEIQPIPTAREGKGKAKEEDDDDELSNQPNPWDNVIIDTMVKRDTEADASGGSSSSSSSSREKSDAQPDTETVTTALPPPRSSSYRCNDNNRQHNIEKHTRSLSDPLPLNPSHSSPLSSSQSPSPSPSSSLPQLQSQLQPRFQFPKPSSSLSLSSSSSQTHPPLPVDLGVPESELAELAWRRRNRAVARAEDLEDGIEHDVRLRHRLAQRRRWFLLWIR